MRLLAISNRQLDRMPWEKLLFGMNDKLPNLAEAILIPEAELVQAKNCRAAALKILQGAGARTVDEWRTILGHKDTLEQLKKWDRFWQLDHEFLISNKGLILLLTEKVHAQCVACFPGKENQAKNIKKAIADLAAVADSELCTACGRSVNDNVLTLMKLLDKFDKGNGPTAAALSAMCPLFQNCFSQLEYNCVVSAQEEGNPVVKVLVGRDAFAHAWKVFSAQAEGSRGLKDVAIFRQFAWMLYSEQSVLVQTIVDAGIRNYRHTHASMPSLEDKQSDVPEIRHPVGSASSSDTTICTALASCGSSVLPSQATSKSKANMSLDLQKQALLEMYHQ